LNAGTFVKPVAPKPEPVAPKPEPVKPNPEPVKPTPEPVKPEPVKPEPVVPEKPAKPVTPAKPTRPSIPTKPSKPVKEPVMPEVKPLPDAAANAAHDALGILIPKAKNRKLAYAVYGLVSLVVSNAAVGVVASGNEAPVWLIVALAVVGNLGAPFATLAIANAGNKN
jgi:outer membrane biosynthesis protein TonB